MSLSHRILILQRFRECNFDPMQRAIKAAIIKMLKSEEKNELTSKLIVCCQKRKKINAAQGQKEFCGDGDFD